MWVLHMQYECVVVTLVVGMLFMWVVPMHNECVVATLVVGMLFMWVVQRLTLIEHGRAYGSLCIMSRWTEPMIHLYSE